jgi:flavodoxin I
LGNLADTQRSAASAEAATREAAMNTLVIYESQFGNTEQIARAIANALARRGPAHLEPILHAEHHVLEGIDLLVLGSPTQYHDATPDMLAWLDRIPPRALDGVHVAVFDTRYRMPRLLSGSAAHVIEQAIQKQGGKLIAPPESFFVAEREGPLEAGEVERAVSWSNVLLDALGSSSAVEASL